MFQKIDDEKKEQLETLVKLLEFLTIVLIIYLLVSPRWLAWKYDHVYQADNQTNWQNKELVKTETEKIVVKDKLKGNYLVIPKIKVKVPIVQGKNADQALNKGAWLLPDGSQPEKGGNTIISGHRFKYLPPSNQTFYLLDKLSKGDLLTVFWQGKQYLYQVERTEVVEPENLSILAPSQESILTLFTCHPIFSEKQRLVVVAKLIEVK